MVSSITSSSSLMTALMAKLQKTQQTDAATKAAAAKQVFAKVDANGDGKVTSDELAAISSTSSSSKAAAIVKANDKDGDNALNQEELASFLNQLTSNGINGSNNAQLAEARGDLMSIADSDEDGSLSYAEFASVKPDDVSDEQSQALFKSVDTDGDGALSSDEVSAFESNRPQGPQAMMGPPPPPPSDDDDDDEEDTTVSSLLSKLLETLTEVNDTKETASTDETDNTTDTTASAQQKLFNFFDQDSDGAVSETELNDGISALKTAMSSYMLSLQESRAAA